MGMAEIEDVERKVGHWLICILFDKVNIIIPELVKESKSVMFKV